MRKNHIKALKNTGRNIITLIMFLSLAVINSHADEYDDAVIAAKNLPKIEIVEPETPTYSETLLFIQESLLYPLSEIEHCKFQYKESGGSLVSIFEFKASELSAKTSEFPVEITCKAASRCLHEDYRGASEKTISVGKRSYMHLDLKSDSLKNDNLTNKKDVNEAFNHLILLCGGARE